MVRVGSVVLRLTGAGRGSGITGWAMGGGAGLPSTVDGITTESHQAPEAAGVTHANGASHVDHVVVATPDIGRTLGALGALGLQVSRTRASGQSGPRARQAFLWSGDVILEVVGPQAADGDGPASLWGLVVVSEHVDDLQRLVGDAVAAPRDAVQPGRRIAPVRREAGSSVPLAFLTPHVGTA